MHFLFSETLDLHLLHRFLAASPPSPWKAMSLRLDRLPARSKRQLHLFPFDIPNATPTANKIAILSMIEEPALIKKAANGLPASHPAGSHPVTDPH